MKLKEIKKHFIVYKTENIYILRSFEPGIRDKNKYLCSFTFNGQKASVEGKPFVDNIEDFKKDVAEHISTLEYSSDYYYPFWRNGVKNQFIIHDFLLSIGFKCTSKGYTKTTEIIYGDVKEVYIDFTGLDPFDLKENVIIHFLIGKNLFYTKEINDPKRIIKQIKATLFPFYTSLSASGFLEAGKVETEENAELSLVQITNLNMTTISYKEKLKQELQKIIDRL